MAVCKFGALTREFYIVEIGTWEKLWWYKDGKGSFRTHHTDNVPGYKKALLFKATSMLAEYQQGGRGLLRWWEKPESLEKNHHIFFFFSIFFPINLCFFK